MGSIGIEWVHHYHGRGADLPSTRPQAEGFYNRLAGVRSFNWGDDLAWDQDFEEAAVGDPPSGADTTWVDNVDIAYFSGHGSLRQPMFGVTGFDSGRVKSSEVRWGNRELEWIVLDACQVLRESGVVDRWGWGRFAGLHYVLGFHSDCTDEDKRGRYFADKLNSGWRVRDAWIHACQETEGSDAEYAYLRADAAGTNTFDDHWHGKGFVSPDPVVPTTIFYLRGSC